MKAVMIVAMARNGVIGAENKMPWHLPGDLRFFRQTTLDHPIIMGRKTLEALGRPLDRRDNIVLTRDKNFSASGVLVAHTIDQAEKIAKECAEKSGVDTYFVIGGAAVFNDFRSRVGSLLLTLIDRDYEGDARISVDLGDWIEINKVECREDDPALPTYSIITLKPRLAQEHSERREHHSENSRLDSGFSEARLEFA